MAGVVHVRVVVTITIVIVISPSSINTLPLCRERGDTTGVSVALGSYTTTAGVAAGFLCASSFPNLFGC